MLQGILLAFTEGTRILIGSFQPIPGLLASSRSRSEKILAFAISPSVELVGTTPLWEIGRSVGK